MILLLVTLAVRTSELLDRTAKLGPHPKVGASSYSKQGLIDRGGDLSHAKGMFKTHRQIVPEVVKVNPTQDFRGDINISVGPCWCIRSLLAAFSSHSQSRKISTQPT